MRKILFRIIIITSLCFIFWGCDIITIPTNSDNDNELGPIPDTNAEKSMVPATLYDGPAVTNVAHYSRENLCAYSTPIFTLVKTVKLQP